MQPERELDGLNAFSYQTSPGIYPTWILVFERGFRGLSFQEFVVRLLVFGLLFILSGGFDLLYSSRYRPFPIVV